MSEKIKNTGMIAVVILIVCATFYGMFKDGGSIGETPSKEMIEAVVVEYLNEHPEVVAKAMEAHYAKQQEEKFLNAQASIGEYSDKLKNDPNSPVLGNPNGAITVVEFFDYSCGYCKKVNPAVNQLINENKDVKLVLKEFPILGEASDITARVALATYLIAPEKYKDVHNKFMETRIRSKAEALTVVKSLGLDEKAIEAKMNDAAITDQINANRMLAQQIGVTGTPGFIIGKQLIPGAIDYETMENIVAEQR